MINLLFLIDFQTISQLLKFIYDVNMYNNNVFNCIVDKTGGVCCSHERRV